MAATLSPKYVFMAPEWHVLATRLPERICPILSAKAIAMFCRIYFARRGAAVPAHLLEPAAI